MGKKEKPNVLPQVEAALNDDERATWAGFIAQIQDQSVDQGAVRGRFFVWAGPIAQRVGIKNPGMIWGALMGAHRPKGKKAEVAIIPLPALADELPYPLGMKLKGLIKAHQRQAEGYAEAQLPFELWNSIGLVRSIARVGGII